MKGKETQRDEGRGHGRTWRKGAGKAQSIFNRIMVSCGSVGEGLSVEGVGEKEGKRCGMTRPPRFGVVFTSCPELLL